MTRLTNRLSGKTAIYSSGIVVVAVAFILLEKWPGARVLMQQLDLSVGITDLNWALLITALLIGFLLGLGVKKRK